MSYIRPGAYINFETVASSLVTVSDRGVVALPLKLDFLEPQTVVEVNVYTDFLNEFGISINDDTMVCVKEALKNAESAYLYRLNTGDKATVTVDDLVATAKYAGEYGNRISFSVLENGSGYMLLVYVDDVLTFEVLADDIDGLNGQPAIVFSGEICTTDKTKLADGVSNDVTEANYTSFFNAIKVYDFNTFAITDEDADIHSLAYNFTVDMRENENMKIQGVLSNTQGIDYEGIINVTNGVILNDDTALSANLVTTYVAGAVAGAQMNESLTHMQYADAKDIYPKFTNSEICDRLEDGEFLFSIKRGKVLVEQDINSFTDYTTTKGKVFSKNRVIRVIDGIATDIKALFEDYYLGKVSNNAAGRSLFAAECIDYLRTLEQMACIEGFNSMEDILVVEGDDSDSINISLNIKPVDSVEKLYMTVYLN